MAVVTELPGVQTTPFDDETSTQNEPTPKAAPRKGGRPKKSEAVPDQGLPRFFQLVAKVPKEDWGTRAFLYLYIDEPVCVDKAWGKSRYAKKLYQPILDLEPIKDMYGSIKGWLSLNVRKSGKDVSDQIDRLDFEIFDPLCPPKIPKNAWANDERNKRWEALLPPEKPQAPGAASFGEAIQVYKDIRDEVRDEMEPILTPPQGDRTKETLETMKIAKELFGTPAPTAPAISPEAQAMSLATQLFTLMNTTKAENPVIDMYKAELQTLREEMKELRKAAPVQKGLIEQVLEIAPVLDKLEPLKKFFGIGGVIRETADGAERVVRATKMGTFEFIADIAPKIIDAPIVNALAAKIMSGMNNGPAPMPAMNGAHPPQRIQQAPPDQFDQWLVIAGNPALMEHFTNGAEGGDLAEWIFWSRPDYLQRIQRFTHPAMPGLIGAPAIIRAYQNTPEVWSHIKGHEVEFGRFVDQLCAWEPTKEEEDPDVIPTTAEPADEWEQGESRPS